MVSKNAGGSILIDAKHVDHNIIITISDDGKGMSQLQITEMRQALEQAVNRTENPEETRDKKGYGMLNVQARIQLTHGEQYGILLESMEGSGTIVTIVLPIIDENDREEEQ